MPLKSRMTECVLNLHLPVGHGVGSRAGKANYYVHMAKSFELQMKANKTF